jgi:hypothetical protein
LQLRALAALSIALGLLATAPSSAAGVERAGDALIFEGRIDAASAARFLQLLREDPKITRLVIASGGGLVGPAIDMAEAIHERGLDVEVPRACHSSCANYIFPAGRHKTLGWPGAVAWHGNMAHVLHLQQTGQAQWSQAEIESARGLAQREAKFFRRVGVDEFVCWFAKLAPYEVPDFYYLSARDMGVFGIRDVTVRTDTARAVDPALRAVVVDWAGLAAARLERTPAGGPGD